MVAARFVLTNSPDENKICSEEERQFLASKRICKIDGTKSPSEEKGSYFGGISHAAGVLDFSALIGGRTSHPYSVPWPRTDKWHAALETQKK